MVNKYIEFKDVKKLHNLCSTNISTCSFVNMVMYYKLKHVEMVESLKSVD